MLERQQQLQEDSYEVPYHWFKERTTQSGRLYYGYLDICIEKLSQLDKETAKILDFGCGDGFLLKMMNDVGCKDLSGIDYSAKAISFAKVLLPQNIKLFSDNLVDNNPFPDNNFDYIFMVEVLEHIPPKDVENLLNVLKKILKPGGKLIITVPSKKIPLASDSHHYQHFDKNTLEIYLAGKLKILEISGQDRFGFHWLKLVYKLFDNNLYTIRPLTEWYNINVWGKYFNKCAHDEGRRMVVVAQK